MDILSLFTDGKGAPVTVDGNDDDKNTENPLQNSAFGEVLARSVEGETLSSEQVHALAQIDGLGGQQVSAQMIALIGQQENAADTFTREEAELWVAEILEQEGVEIDLSLLDREKIIQILLGIEEDPLEDVEAEEATEAVVATQEADEEADEALLAQQQIQLHNETAEVLPAAAALVANDNSQELSADGAYVETPAQVQDVMTVMPVASVVLPTPQAAAAVDVEISTGLTLADAAISQALLKAREAFDRMTQVVPPSQPQATTALTAADFALEEFTPVALLEGAYVPVTDGNQTLALAEQAVRQGFELPGIDRSAALTNVGVKQEGQEPKGNNVVNVGAERVAPKVVQTETVIQSNLAVPEVQKDETLTQMKQSNEAVQQQQAANHSQQHSAQAWERNAPASDRVYTMQPGAKAGGAADQVNVSIRQGINTGLDRMIIQLEPADLGRVEIKMDVQDGRVQMIVTADKGDTLDLLQRDARSLERALAEAGLDMDSGGMEFQLGGQENDDESGNGEGTGTGFANNNEEETELLAPEVIDYTVSVEEGLNITV